MSAWDEIRKLQAMLSEVQQIDVSQRLSERNCVEIMMKLIELRLVDVVHTLDGREYVTQDQISREIRDEIAMRGGRSEFGDLQSALNVDINHIQKKVDDITKRDKRSSELQVVMGQIVTASYLDNLADELVDELNAAGSLRYADVAKRYDLPAEFVRDTLGDRLARRVRVRFDEATATIYTACFYEMHGRKLRGALTGALHPVALAPLCAALGLHERVAHGALEECVRSRSIRGEIIGASSSGSKASLQKATFVPEIYAKTQREFVANALRARRFIDFATLARINLPDASSAYLRRAFGNEFQLHFFDESAVTQDAIELCEATCEDCVRTGTGCVDLSSVLPSGLPHKDACALIETVIKRVTKSLAQSDEGLGIVRLENWRPSAFNSDNSASDSSSKRQVAVLVGDVTLVGAGVFNAAWSQLATHVDAKAVADAELEEYNKPAFLQQLRARLAGGSAPTTATTTAGSSRKGPASEADEPSKRSHTSKATKKKYNPRGAKGGRNAASQRDEDEVEDDDYNEDRGQQDFEKSDTDWLVEGVRRFEIDESVSRAFADVTDDSAINTVASAFHRQANCRYQHALCAALGNKQSVTASAQAEVDNDRKKRYQRVIELLQSRLHTIRLVQRGCDLLSGTLTSCPATAATAQNTMDQIAKHVLRTRGTELFIDLVAVTLFDHSESFQSEETEGTGRNKWTFDQLVALDAERTTPEMRVAWVEQIGALHKELRAPFAKLAQTISKPSVVDFITQFETISSMPVLELSLKRLDNKLEKNLLFDYKHSNLETLNSMLVPNASAAQQAEALQLATSLLFSAQTKTILHVPSRLSRVVFENVVAPLFSDAQELEPLARLGANVSKVSSDSQSNAASANGQKLELDQETCERITQLVKSAFQRNWKAGRAN